MFLIAQHVVTPEGSGINAYYHAHGPRQDWVWQPPENIPDGDPGKLSRSKIEIEGRGRIASYLDIAAPDGTPARNLRWAHNAIAALIGAKAVFPIVVLSGPIFVRYDLELPLRANWHGELHALLDAALALAPDA
jgi:hypothetical protein